MTTLRASRIHHGAPLASALHRYPLTAYFLLAYLGSWIVWLPMVLAGNNVLLPAPAISPGLKFLLTLLAPFAGPTLAAFIMTAVEEGRAGVRGLLSRLIQWRFSFAWYLVALVGPILALLLAVAARYGPAALPPREQSGSIAVAYAITLVVNFFIGGILGEEPGWRGFALPRLQGRYGPLLGSLILSLLWSAWHLPLILTPGGTTWTGNFVLYVALNFAFSLLLTWVSNGTRSSLLGVMLLHAAINTSARLILPNVPGLSRDEGNLLLVVVYGALALLLVVLTRGRLAESAEHASLRKGENQ